MLCSHLSIHPNILRVSQRQIQYCTSFAILMLYIAPTCMPYGPRLRVATL